MMPQMLQHANVPARATGSTGTNADLLELLVLRKIESSGPMTGLEAVNGIASIAGLLRITPPGYPLLHGLTDRGLLETSSGTPRRYSLTDAGGREAELLAERCWPRVRDEVLTLSLQLAPAMPRTRGRMPYVSEWTADHDDGRWRAEPNSVSRPGRVVRPAAETR
jgi:DNA-binding PadR family transcriptional regulator